MHPPQAKPLFSHPKIWKIFEIIAIFIRFIYKTKETHRFLQKTIKTEWLSLGGVHPPQAKPLTARKLIKRNDIAWVGCTHPRLSH